MQTQVSILHHDYPQRVRVEVEEKLEGLTKFFDRVVTMRALLERQNEDHRVEIVANVGNGSVLVADARESALSTAIDEAADRMGTLLKRYKDKLADGRRRSGRNGRA